MLCPFYFIQLRTLKCTIANEMQIFDRNNKGDCLKRKRPSPGACSGASVLCLMYKIISTARIPAPCSWKQIILLCEHFLYIMDRSDITGVVIHLYLGWYQNSFSVEARPYCLLSLSKCSSVYSSAWHTLLKTVLPWAFLISCCVYMSSINSSVRLL